MKYIYCIIFGIIFYLLSNNINGFSISNQISIENELFEKYIQVYNEDKCILDLDPANSNTIEEIKTNKAGPCLYCTVRKYLKLLDYNFVINNETEISEEFKKEITSEKLINYFKYTITPHLKMIKLIPQNYFFNSAIYSNLQGVIETMTHNSLLHNVMLVSVSSRDGIDHLFMIYITDTEIIIIEGEECGSARRFVYKGSGKLTHKTIEAAILLQYEINISDRENYKVYGYEAGGDFVKINQSDYSKQYLNDLINKQSGTSSTDSSCTLQ